MIFCDTICLNIALIKSRIMIFFLNIAAGSQEPCLVSISKRLLMISSVFSYNIFNQLTKYFGVSIVAAFFDLVGVYLAQKYLEMQYVGCVFFGFALGTLCNFIVSNRYVFHHNSSLLAKIFRHYISSCGGLAMNMFVVVVCVEFMEFNLITAKVMALPVGFLFNFFAIKIFAFRDWSFK